MVKKWINEENSIRDHKDLWGHNVKSQLGENKIFNGFSIVWQHKLNFIHFHCIGVEADISETDIPKLSAWRDTYSQERKYKVKYHNTIIHLKFY